MLVSHMSWQGRRIKRNPTLICNAIQRISQGHSLNSVAKAAGIPEASLRRYNTKPEMIDRPTGPKTLLTDEEELGLATAALWLKERGLPLDVLQLKCSAKEVVLLKPRMASLVMNGLKLLSNGCR